MTSAPPGIANEAPPRCGAYRKSGKNGGATATMPKNAKSENPQGIKPISAIADQQSASHLSSYGKNGEGKPLWKIRRNVYREQWNPVWFWNGSILPL